MDPRWSDVGNNLCGVVDDCRSAYAAAGAFVSAGWSRRSSSWHGWEVETGWGQIELDPIEGHKVLLNGVIDPQRVDDLASLLSSFGLRFTLELYSDTDLVREIRV